MFVFRKQKEEWRMQRIPILGLKKKILITGYVQVRTYDFHCKMCNSNTFFIACAELRWKSMNFSVLSSLETVHDTVQ